jgi:acetyltransferase-like isoleucine patch superfamily enzyme
MTAALFHPLVPGNVLPGDWHPGRIPDNIEVGENARIDSSFCFRRYFATGALGLRVGRDVTIWRTALATAADALIEIGDGSYLSNALLICSGRITLGARVLVAGGATIADSDFHPIDPAARLADTVAISPAGSGRRPPIAVRPVVLEDDVWVGFNAAILKGVRVGAGAVVEPGAVVTRDVPAGAVVAGNPARVVDLGARPGRGHGG